MNDLDSLRLELEAERHAHKKDNDHFMVLLKAHRKEFLAECERQGDSEEDAQRMLADFERENLETVV